MKKSSRVIIGISLLSLAICSTSCGTQTLYNWDKYENVSYAYTKEPNEKHEEDLMKCYDKMLFLPVKADRIYEGVNILCEGASKVRK